MAFTTAGSVGATAPTVPPASRDGVRQLLDEHRPREMVENMALIIMDQTYGALLEILGPGAPPFGDGHVQVSRPLDPADPDSPLLSVNASPTHCRISLLDSFCGGATAPEAPQHRLPRTTIAASPGTLHLARVDGGGLGGYWACADVWPDVSAKGLLGVLEAIKKRVDAAIRLEASLLRMARDSGCQQSPKVREITEVRVALEKMRAAVDLDGIMRRRRYRRPLIQEEISCRPDVDHRAYDDAEVLAKRLSAMHVGQKRGPPEISCRQADDAEVLAKRLRTLDV